MIPKIFGGTYRLNPERAANALTERIAKPGYVRKRRSGRHFRNH